MTRMSLRHRRYTCGRVQALQNKVSRLEVALKDALEDRERAHRFAELAFVDALTGLPNRRAFDHAIERELERARRGFSEPLTLAIMDVDHFKRVNDTYGHVMGDVVLNRIGTILKGATRSVDFVGRYGGEEFVLLFPKTSIADARILVERLRSVSLQSGLSFQTPGTEENFSVTLSFGLTEWRGYHEGVDEWKGRADAALYEAKRLGRNRVVCAD